MTRDLIAGWPRALRLLIAILGKDAQTAHHLSQSMTDRDWAHFSDLAIERHRVAPLITPHLHQLAFPEQLSALLSTSAQANAIQVLHQVSALRSIQQCFDARDIQFAVLKGWPLSEDLFDNNNARQTKDIDLLVDPAATQSAADALASIGFHPADAHPERFRMLGTPALQSEFNNVSLTHASSGLCIELHWRCHQFTGWPELFAGGTNLTAQETSIGTLMVPNPRSNLIYLAIHGSMHRWSRLKWLCDVAELAARRGTSLLKQDLEFAHSIGAGKPLELALRLSSAVLGAPCPETATGQTWLLSQCLVEIQRPQAIPTGTWHRMKFYAMMLALSDNMAQRIGVLRYRVWGKHRLALAAARQSK